MSITVGEIKKSIEDLKSRIERASSISNPTDRVPVLLLLLKKLITFYIELIKYTKKLNAPESTIKLTIDKIKPKVLAAISEIESTMEEYVYDNNIDVNAKEYEKFCTKIKLEYFPSSKSSESGYKEVAAGFEDDKYRNRIKNDDSEEIIGSSGIKIAKSHHKITEDEISVAAKLTEDSSLKINVKKCVDKGGDNYEW
jgi:hypothetical protein